MGGSTAGDGYRRRGWNRFKLAGSRLVTVALVMGVGVSGAIAAPSATADPRCQNNDPFIGHCVGGRILEEYNQTGPANGYANGFDFFGNAVTPESNAVNGRWQAFERGSSIYWNPNVSGGHANQLGGLIRQRWYDLGYETSPLRYPTSRELPARKPGRFNRFEGGNIYHRNGDSAAHNIWGQILSKWGSLDHENGRLGFPMSDEFVTKNDGRGQHFEGGELYWSQSSGAHPVWGDIRQQWVNANYENGLYGYPVGDEVNGGNTADNASGFEGRCQEFQGGVLTAGFSRPLYDKNFSSVTRTTDNRLTLLIRSTSKYATEFNAAVSLWNTKGRVNLRAATAGENQPTNQLLVRDVSRSDASYLGIYAQFVGIDMNTWQLDKPQYGSANDKNVMIHEMGHALGMRHSCEGNIMLARTTTRVTFGTIDDYSYRQMWG